MLDKWLTEDLLKASTQQGKRGKPRSVTVSSSAVGILQIHMKEQAGGEQSVCSVVRDCGVPTAAWGLGMGNMKVRPLPPC